RTRVTALAEATGLTRFAIAHSLIGKVEPQLPQLLRFVEHTSLRLLDSLDALTDVRQLPRLDKKRETLQAACSVGYEQPLSPAVLRALETSTYAESAGAVADIEKIVGVEQGLERCLQLLVQSGRSSA